MLISGSLIDAEAPYTFATHFHCWCISEGIQSGAD